MIVWLPLSCTWSPNRITGPNTERLDRVFDSEAADGGVSRGVLIRRRQGERTENPVRVTEFSLDDVVLPSTDETVVVAAWVARDPNPEPDGEPDPLRSRR